MKFDQLVEKAYSLFSDYKLTDKLDVCKVCCVTDSEEQDLLKTPLRDLTEDMLSIYLNSARCYSEKEQHEMCYFLPRILELTVEGKCPICFEPSLLDRLFSKDNQFGGTDEEYTFLQKFLEEYMICFLNNNKSPLYIEDILIIAAKHFDIVPLFKIWKHIASLQSTIHFAHFILEYDQYHYAIDRTYPSLNELATTWLKQKETYKHFSDLLVNYYFDKRISDRNQLDLESALVLYQSFYQKQT